VLFQRRLAFGKQPSIAGPMLGQDLVKREGQRSQVDFSSYLTVGGWGKRRPQVFLAMKQNRPAKSQGRFRV
jgi:hypothetical protein